MKLKYKILWLDDKIEEFIEDEVIEEIEKHLKNKGFLPEIITVSNAKDFFDKLDESYDLILTDFHMNDMNGNKVVEKIRSSEYSVMTEILFYTAKADLTDTQKISRVSFLETNSSTDAHIEKVIETTIGLIDLTIKKFQNIVAMRGMIMHETSFLDETTLDIIENIYDTKNDAEIKGALFNEIISFHSEKHKKAVRNKKNDRIDLIFKDSVTFSASQRANTVSKIIDKVGIVNFIHDYRNQIINNRNLFAHAVLDEEKQIFKTRDGIEFNEDSCREIRNNINTHILNFENLIKKLNE